MSLGGLLHTLGDVAGVVLPFLKDGAVVAVPLVGAAIAGVVKDAHKRALLQEVAQGAVAAALLRYPNIAQDSLVNEVVSLIMGAPNPPTTNKDAVARAVRSAAAYQQQALVTASTARHPGA